MSNKRLYQNDDFFDCACCTYQFLELDPYYEYYYYSKNECQSDKYIATELISICEICNSKLIAHKTICVECGIEINEYRLNGHVFLDTEVSVCKTGTNNYFTYTCIDHVLERVKSDLINNPNLLYDKDRLKCANYHIDEVFYDILHEYRKLLDIKK